MEILNSEKKNDESYLPDVNKTFQNTDEASEENEITNLPPISSDEQKSEKDDGMEEPPQEEEKQNQTNDKEVLSDRSTEQQSDRDGQHAGEVEQATKAEQEPQVDREPQQEYDDTYHSTLVTDTDEQHKNDTERENRHGSENDGRDSVVDDREEDEHKEIPDETYGGLQDDYGKKSHRSDSSMSSRSEDSDKAKEDQKTEPVKQNQAQQSRKSVRMDDSVKTNKTSTTTTKTKGNTPSSSSNSSSPAHKHATRTTSRSAQPFRRPDHKPEASTKSTSFVSLRRPKTSNYGSMISRESNKKKDYFQEELRRLRVRLGKEAENIKKPQFKEHVPFVWTSLEPYYNTYVPNYLINLPDEELQPQRPVSRGRPPQGDDFHQGYTTRSTAIGLCDPWIDLRMDKNILPKLEQPKGQGRDKPKSQKKKKESSPKEGSTRLPKFPVVDFNSGKENATKKFPYNEVAKFRTELKDRFSSNAKKKVNKDYKRTKDDFYRMDLHKLDEIHPLNRPHMRRTYFAYLQNTPGSRKAVKDCVKTLDTDEGNEQDEQETPALEETHHQQAVAST
ncbi:myb-like protein X isoform X2 [Pecten maximus]|uniref:myb-like protein X isoform X2 n=1 Tax=Pecten maximus TaxID=6579 RepID=UPI001458271B|nr:myb-like protein X isoform X2 [Pecten maximus]